jgi:hypothetical protein
VEAVILGSGTGFIWQSAGYEEALKGCAFKARRKVERKICGFSR